MALQYGLGSSYNGFYFSTLRLFHEGVARPLNCASRGGVPSFALGARMRHRLAVLAFAIASILLLSPRANADTYLFDFTAYIVPETGSPGTENIQFDLTAATLPASGDVTSFTSVTGPFGTVSDFQWNSAASAFCEGSSSGGNGCAGFLSTGLGAYSTYFPAGSFLTTGTFDGGDASLVITDLTTAPEPSAPVLLALGLIGLGATRLARRWLLLSDHLQKAF